MSLSGKNNSVKIEPSLLRCEICAYLCPDYNIKVYRNMTNQSNLYCNSEKPQDKELI